MKKIFALLAALLIISGMVFAQEVEWQTEESQPAERQIEQRQTAQEQTQQQQTEETEQRQRRERQIEFFNLEFSLGFPVHFTNGVNSNGTDDLDKIFNANTAFGLTTTFNFTDRVGLTLDMDIFYGARLQGLSTDNSNFTSLFGANVILGPVFNVVNVDRLRIPLGFGVHMFYFSDQFWNPDLGNSSGEWVGRKDLQLGLAAWLAIQYHFDSKIYIFSRTNVMLDVFRMVTLEGSTESSDTFIMEFNWGIKPSIGIGLRI